jgi:hypothetical protein
MEEPAHRARPEDGAVEEEEVLALLVALALIWLEGMEVTVFKAV